MELTSTWSSSLYGLTITHGLSTLPTTRQDNGSQTNETDVESVHDKRYNKTFRIVSLYIIILCGTIGGVILLVWMRYSRRRKSRVNLFILNLTVADLSVILLACLPQLFWEYAGREWRAGEALCKILKFFQSFTMMSSSNMLLVIAIDRHQAIRSPLMKPYTVWKMAGIGWAFAAATSSPMFFVFHLNVVDNNTRCENTFRDRPIIYRQIFLTYAAVVVFFVPIIILIVCYARIFLKIARKASENKASNQQNSMKPGKVHLQSTKSSSLPKAKIKTLKMTLVIVAVYIACSLPYFSAEMILSYTDHTLLSPEFYAILGGVAAANSAANPYVFLLFNANNCSCLSRLNFRRVSYTDTGPRRSRYISTSTRSEMLTNNDFKPYVKFSQSSRIEMSAIAK